MTKQLLAMVRAEWMGSRRKSPIFSLSHSQRVSDVVHSGIGQPFVMTPAIQGTEYTYFDQVESPLSGPLVTPTKTPSMLRTYPSPASDQDQGSPVSSSSSSPLLYSQALIPEWNRAPTPQLLFDDMVLFDSPEG